jgi:phosphoenolpyruvate carboxylase
MRQLRGVHARLAASAAALLGAPLAGASAKPHRALPAYESPDELAADLRTLDESLAGHGAGALAGARLAPLRRAVAVFGFHLAPLDLRQNSAVHEAAVAELLHCAGVTAAAGAYAALDEAGRVALLTAELRSPRPLACAHAAYSPRTASELAVGRAAAHVVQRFGEAALPNYVISNCAALSDLLEVAVLLKEAGLLVYGAAAGGGAGAAAGRRRR